MLQSINPYTQDKLKSYPKDAEDTINQKLLEAQNAQKKWRKTPIKERCDALVNLAELILFYKEKMAIMATDEMGKHIRESRAEVEKCATVLKYYAAHAEEILKPQAIKTEFDKSYITYNPLGIILAVMPWNFPFWQVFRALAPIIVGGNAFVLKHASNVSGCASIIEQIINDSLLPKGLFQWLRISSDSVETVINHPIVNAITLTGSTVAGSAVATIAASKIKKQVLELGGSDAYIILEDADIHASVKICLDSRMNNNGQSCISAKRIIVVGAAHDYFLEELHNQVTTITFGNPHNDDNRLGVMVSIEARAELHRQVEACVQSGAKLIMGGYIPEGKSAAYPPTILSEINEGMPAWEEEMFGPVFTVIRATSEVHAIDIANQHKYGLGGAIFSKNNSHAEYVAAELIDAGFVAVNDFVRSDARLPFGGVKESGYGRELSANGLTEFCNIKTVTIRNNEV